MSTNRQAGVTFKIVNDQPKQLPRHTYREVENPSPLYWDSINRSLDSKIYNTLKKSPSMIKPLQPYEESVSVAPLDFNLNYSPSRRHILEQKKQALPKKKLTKREKTNKVVRQLQNSIVSSSVDLSLLREPKVNNTTRSRKLQECWPKELGGFKDRLISQRKVKFTGNPNQVIPLTASYDNSLNTIHTASTRFNMDLSLTKSTDFVNSQMNTKSTFQLFNSPKVNGLTRGTNPSVKAILVQNNSRQTLNSIESMKSLHKGGVNMGSQVSLLTQRMKGRNQEYDSTIHQSSTKKQSQYRYSIMSPNSPAEYLSPTFNSPGEVGTQLNLKEINHTPVAQPFPGAAAYAKFNYTGWNTSNDQKPSQQGNGYPRRKLSLRHCIKVNAYSNVKASANKQPDTTNRMGSMRASQKESDPRDVLESMKNQTGAFSICDWVNSSSLDKVLDEELNNLNKKGKKGSRQQTKTTAKKSKLTGKKVNVQDFDTKSNSTARLENVFSSRLTAHQLKEHFSPHASGQGKEASQQYMYNEDSNELQLNMDLQLTKQQQSRMGSTIQNFAPHSSNQFWENETQKALEAVLKGGGAAVIQLPTIVNSGSTTERGGACISPTVAQMSKNDQKSILPSLHNSHQQMSFRSTGSHLK